MEVSSLPEKKVPYLRRRIGVVFQDFQLLPDRSVFENVAFALRVTGHKKSFIKQRVVEVLGLVGLSHKRKSMPDDLSGGEKQRVVIARALANEPRLLLADEPTGNLDPDASASVMDLLQQINNRGMTVLMVTHDYDVIRRFPNRTVKIENGTLFEMTGKKMPEL
jgi:cell division transport system ATP-binding protein